MPDTHKATASLATAGITFLEIRLNGTKLPVSRIGVGKFSGRVKLSLPNSFPAVIDVKGLFIGEWKVSLEVLRLADSKSVLKQDMTGNIGGSRVDQWEGTLMLSA